MTPEQRAAARKWISRQRPLNPFSDDNLATAVSYLYSALDELDARDAFERQQSATIDDCVARIARLEAEIADWKVNDNPAVRDLRQALAALGEVSDAYPMHPPCRSCMHAACIARRALSEAT